MSNTAVIPGPMGVVLVSFLALPGESGGESADCRIAWPALSHTRPSTRSPRVHSLAPGMAVQRVCSAQGQTVNGSSRWFRIIKDGLAGYVHSDAVATPVAA